MSTIFRAMRQRLAALAVRIGIPARSREMMPAEIDPGSREMAGEPFGCVELYAGNEWAHRHVELPGLEGDVIALPSEGREGGDLYALFSCGGERIARIVLADAVGHGFSAGQIAARIHRLLHEFRDIRDPMALLAALNDTFLSDQKPGAPSRLTTVATANYNCDTGEFSYAYAGHPRMLLWRARSAEWCPLGKDDEGGLPLGVRALELYSQQSVWLEPGDMVMAFSDATSEAESPDGTQLTVKGFQQLAGSVTSRLPHPMSLHDQSKQLIEGISHHHHSDKFEDDLTLLTIRRSGSEIMPSARALATPRPTQQILQETKLQPPSLVQESVAFDGLAPLGELSQDIEKTFSNTRGLGTGMVFS